MRTKSFPNPLTSLLAAIGFTVATLPALGQTPVISSFSQNGQLVCTNLQPGSLASVEWASSVLGPWTKDWTALTSVMADTNGTIRVAVPMFYRVKGTPRTNSTRAEMGLIPAGAVQMGDNLDGEIAALPVHTVFISAFYMDKYEVTKALWDNVYQWAVVSGYEFDYSASGKGTNYPAGGMTWYDAVKWCNARSEKEGRTAAYYTSAAQTTVYRSGQIGLQNDWVNWNAGYRLPTEAEWEKAARGGATGQRFPWGDAITHSQANYVSDSAYSYDISPTRGLHPAFNDGVSPYTSPVGSFAPNGYGLYDIAGNVWESCWDWYDTAYYASSSATDPRGPETGSERVIRGGWWNYYARVCRSSFRSGFFPTSWGESFGFRCALPAGQ